MNIFESLYDLFCIMVSDFTLFQWLMFGLIFVILWCVVAYCIKEIIR